MSIFDDIAELDRPQFFNGQRLFASDLQGLETLNREMRWLHNQSLHQPGIGNGYAVTGKKGANSVTIGPGYALDSTGREIVLTSTTTLSIPPVAGQPDGTPSYYDLTVSYPDDSQLPTAETRAGVCAPQGVIRLLDQPLFCWVALAPLNGDPTNLVVAEPAQAQAISHGDMIVLTQIAVLDCALYQDVSLVQRRSARPTCAPYIAAGTETPSWLSSTPFPPPAESRPVVGPSVRRATVTPLPGAAVNAGGSFLPFLAPIRLIANVDTSRAGFRTVPAYSARISAPSRLLTATGDGSSVQFIADGLVTVTNPTATNFSVDVAILISAPTSNELVRMPDFRDDGFVQLFQSWMITWFGVEG